MSAKKTYVLQIVLIFFGNNFANSGMAYKKAPKNVLDSETLQTWRREKRENNKKMQSRSLKTLCICK